MGHMNGNFSFLRRDMARMRACVRRRLRCLDKEACSALLWPSVGRRDVVKHIMSFVDPATGAQFFKLKSN